MKTLFTGNEFLKRVFPERRFVIGPCDGSEILSEAKEVHVEIRSGCGYESEKGNESKEIEVGVYQLVKHMRFPKLLRSVKQEMSTLCFSDSQMLNFIRLYRDIWVHAGQETYMLLGARRKFYCAQSHYPNYYGDEIYFDVVINSVNKTLVIDTSVTPFKTLIIIPAF
jgi:hypothetical protein